jgi:hypothetical protein
LVQWVLQQLYRGKRELSGVFVRFFIAPSSVPIMTFYIVVCCRERGETKATFGTIQNNL